MSNHSEKLILEKLTLLVQENLDNPSFSLDSLGKELGISRSQLHRTVKNQTQLSITLFARSVKLQKAKELLSTTDQRISEIAYSVGIDSPQSFSKYFTEEFGISPSEFRRLKEEQNVEIAEFDNGFPQSHDSQPPVRGVSESQAVENKAIVKQKNNYWWIGLGLFLLAGIGFVVWKQSTASANKSVAFAESESSLAILPFKNLGPTETAYFSEGVMEQIHSSLALIENLKIISKTSSSQYQDTKKSIPQIAKELNVSYILEGTVLQIDGKVRITVELSKASENRAVWTQNYEGEMKDVFGYMSSVAKKIAGELNQKLSATLNKKFDKAPTENINAYNEYLQGRQLMRARSKEKLESALLKFDKAIGLDANFADAYAQKAITYYLLVEDSHIDSKAGIKLVEQNALTAIRLQAENGTAYAILGVVYQKQNKWEQANTSFQIALKNNPNDAQINYWYSLMLRSVGELESAIQYSAKALTLDPLFPTAFVGHVGNLMYAGKMSEARKTLEEGKALFGDFYMYYWASGFYYVFSNDFNTASGEFNKGNEMVSAVNFRSMGAYCEAKMGHKEAAETYLKSLADTPENHDSFAIVHAGLGNADLCIAYLQKGVDADNLPKYLKVSPLFKFLRTDSRFQAVLQKAGLDNQHIKGL